MGNGVRDDTAVSQQVLVSASRVLTLAIAIQAVVLVIAWIGFHFSSVDVSWGASAVFVVSGIAGAMASYWIGRVITRSNTRMGTTLRDHCAVLHRVFRLLGWWQIGVLALAAGVCEELLFRGFLQPWFASFSTSLVGLVAASVLFGLLHYASFTYFLITAVMGMILGAVYWLSESLLAVIVWHGVYDLIALGVLAKYPQVLGIAPELIGKEG